MACDKILWYLCSLYELYVSSLGAPSVWLVLGSFWYPRILFLHFPLSASPYSGTTNDSYLTEQSFPQGVWRSLTLKEWHLETKMWALAVFTAVQVFDASRPFNSQTWGIPTASCEEFWRIRIASHFQPSHWGRMPMPRISQSNLWTSLGIWNLVFLLPSACLEEKPFLVCSTTLGPNCTDESMGIWFPRVAIS